MSAKLQTAHPLHNFRSWHKPITFAMLCLCYCAITTGCNFIAAPIGALGPSVGFVNDQIAYNDPVDELMLGWRNYVWAKKAWANYRSCNRDIPYMHDFGEGYKAGYIAVASGGDGCVPLLPPRRYWSWRYQTPEGQCKVNAWFEAFPLGAAQAEQDGVDNWSEIQLGRELKPQPSKVPAPDIQPTERLPEPTGVDPRNFPWNVSPLPELPAGGTPSVPEGLPVPREFQPDNTNPPELDPNVVPTDPTKDPLKNPPKNTLPPELRLPKNPKDSSTNPKDPTIPNLPRDPVIPKPKETEPVNPVPKLPKELSPKNGVFPTKPKTNIPKEFNLPAVPPFNKPKEGETKELNPKLKKPKVIPEFSPPKELRIEKTPKSTSMDAPAQSNEKQGTPPRELHPFTVLGSQDHKIERLPAIEVEKKVVASETQKVSAEQESFPKKPYPITTADEEPALVSPQKTTKQIPSAPLTKSRPVFRPTSVKITKVREDQPQIIKKSSSISSRLNRYQMQAPAQQPIKNTIKPDTPVKPQPSIKRLPEQKLPSPAFKPIPSPTQKTFIPSKSISSRLQRYSSPNPEPIVETEPEKNTETQQSSVIKFNVDEVPHVNELPTKLEQDFRPLFLEGTSLQPQKKPTQSRATKFNEVKLVDRKPAEYQQRPPASERYFNKVYQHFSPSQAVSRSQDLANQYAKPIKPSENAASVTIDGRLESSR